jgi:hypothetical protein
MFPVEGRNLDLKLLPNTTTVRKAVKTSEFEMKVWTVCSPIEQ